MGQFTGRFTLIVNILIPNFYGQSFLKLSPDSHVFQVIGVRQRASPVYVLSHLPSCW